MGRKAKDQIAVEGAEGQAAAEIGRRESKSYEMLEEQIEMNNSQRKY